MTIDVRQFREEVVWPGVTLLPNASRAAEQIVLATAAAESEFRWIKQVGGGPALGFFQMEPATHDDIWENYLCYKPEVAATIVKVFHGRPSAAEMIWNLRYAAVMCRVHYLRRREALPAAGDLEGMARYWKRYYNTEKGAGTIGSFVLKAREHVPADLLAP